MYFSSEGKGTVSYDSSSGWYTYKPSSLADDTTVTLTIEATNLLFRAYNQFWVEWDNANSSAAMRFSLLRALPVYDEVKADVVTAGSGKSETSKSLDGLGAPGRLRGIRAVFYHKTSSYATSVVTKQIRFRARLRLIDGSMTSNLWTPLSGAQSQTVASSFSSSAKSAAESKRTSLKNATASLKTTAQASGTSNANKIAAYESLFAHRDGDAREIEKAALAVEAKAHESQGKILYGCASSMDKIARDGVFAGTYGASLSISAARGEAEAAQIALYPSVAMSGVRAVVSALVSESGASLDPSLLTVSPVGYVKPTYPAYVSPASMRDTIADPILEWADSLDLESERFQPYWVEASIPEKTAPGVYSGSVTFTDSAGRSASVPLSVKVRRMSLPRHRRLPVVFSSNVFTASTGMQIAYERDAAVIGELANFFKSESGDPSSLSSGALAAWTRAKRMYDMLIAHNLPYQNIYCSPSTVQPKWIRDMRLSDCPSLYTIGYDKVSPAVDVVGEHVAAMGDHSSSIWFYGYDEVSSASAYAAMKKSFGSVKAAYPQVKTFCTALDGTFGETSGCLTEVDAWVDPEDRFSGSGHQANAAKARARGKQVWFYPCNWPVIPWANYHLENSGVANRVVTGAAAWKKKTDGVLYYSIDSPSPYVDTPIISGGFDSFATGAAKTRLGNSGWDRDITLTTSSSTTSTKAERWETFADGVDRLPAVRIRGQVYVNNFRKSSGWGCNVELRFNYVDKSLGDNGQEQNFYNVDVSKTKQWQTIDMTVTPKGEAVNCLFRVYAKSTSAKVIFRDMRVEYADGHTVNRKLGASGPLPRNTVVFENACYGSFRSNGDGSLVYPGPDGPSSSIRLKCVRDGIDDYEYLHMLSNAVIAVRSGRVVLENASQFLSRAASALAVPSDVCSSFTSYASEGRKLVAWRDEMGDLLDEYFDVAESEGEANGVFDSFETFEGESEASVYGFPGDDGKSEPWTGSGAVVVSDGTAFHGTKFLRLADNDDKQHNATKRLEAASLVNLADGPVPFSFAFRRLDSDAQTTALTGCNMSIGARSEALATNKSLPNKDIFANPVAAWQDGVVTGRWYFIEGELSFETVTDEDGLETSRVAFRAKRITDTFTRQPLPGVDGSATYAYATVAKSDDWSLLSLNFFTWSGYRGFVDIDAIRIGEGPSFSLYDSAENFSGDSGASSDGYAGDDGRAAWSGAESIMSDDTAFEGDRYFRIIDEDANQHNLRKVFPVDSIPPFPLADGEGIPFSFAFRRYPSSASDASLSGCNITFGARAASIGKTTSTSGVDIFATPKSAWPEPPAEGRWYLVEGRLCCEAFTDRNGAPKNRIAYRADRIVDTELGVEVAGKDALSSAYTYVNVDPATDWTLTYVRFMTWGQSQAIVDIDAVRFGSSAPRCISKGPLKESFETFPRAYNTTIAGYHGDDGAGKWSVGQSAVVMTGDDGFAGAAYLRIADNTTSQHSATKSILPAYRPRVARPGERRCGFSFSFRRTPVDATSSLTGCKLKLYAVSPTTGERLDYSDGADIFKTPSSIADALSENEAWYRVTGHVSLETPSQGRRRLAYRVNSVINLETGEVLYSAPGEGLLYSYKDAVSDADDFVLSGFTFFTFGASKGFIDLDDFSLGNRPPEGFTIRLR
jgi:single-stranded DNA-binding protein